MFILIAGGFLAYAWWTKSNFWQIMAGLVTIAVGIEFISRDAGYWANVTLGSAIIAVGLYELIMVAVNMFKGE